MCPLTQTGAGGIAFSAVVFDGLVTNREPKETMQRAAATATAVITQVGARLTPAKLKACALKERCITLVIFKSFERME